MLYLANNRLLLINNGNSLYRIEGEEPAPVGGDEFIFTIDTSLGQNAGPSFTLPLKEYMYDYYTDTQTFLNYNMIVDWGDGSPVSTITSWNDSNKTHTYTTNNQYQISILGTCEGWGTLDNQYNWEYNYTDQEKIIGIDQWGEVGFIDLFAGFLECHNLSYVNYYSNGNWSQNVVNMNSMFFMYYYT